MAENIADKKLSLMGSVSQTGYGHVTYNILKYLTEAGWDVSLFAKGGTDRTSKEELEIIRESAKRSETFDYHAPCLNIWHQFDLANRIGNGKYFVYPFFELDCLNNVEKHHLNYPDELIVSSKWAKTVLENNSIKTRINIISPGVDTNIFYPKNPTAEERCIFLNCGKWEIRKGHDFLVDVFHQAFSIEDNVELWMMPTNKFLSQQESRNWENLYMNTALGKVGKIKIINWFNTHEQVANVMSMVDCGVFPSRGEGWNMELMEMMAMGKPVIATNYSAHTEFCNDNNCMLIDVQDVEPAYDGKWFFEQGNWAKIEQKQLKDLKDHMRAVYEAKKNNIFLFNKDGVETAKKYSWENCVKKLESVLTN